MQQVQETRMVVRALLLLHLMLAVGMFLAREYRYAALQFVVALYFIWTMRTFRKWRK